MFRQLMPDRLARWTGSRRSAVHHLRRTIHRDRVRKRVKPSERVGPPFGRVTPEDALSGELVEHGPRGTPQALKVQYRLPGAGYRLAFIARAEDGTAWLLCSLLPTDPHLMTFPEGEEVRNEYGQRCVRRGWGLAVADPCEGTAEGTYQVLVNAQPARSQSTGR